MGMAIEMAMGCPHEDAPVVARSRSLMRVGLVEHLNHTRFKLLELSVSWNDAFGGCGPTQVHGAARSTAVFHTETRAIHANQVASDSSRFCASAGGCGVDGVLHGRLGWILDRPEAGSATSGMGQKLSLECVAIS